MTPLLLVLALAAGHHHHHRARHHARHHHIHLRGALVPAPAPALVPPPAPAPPGPFQPAIGPPEEIPEHDVEGPALEALTHEPPLPEGEEGEPAEWVIE